MVVHAIVLTGSAAAGPLRGPRHADSRSRDGALMLAPLSYTRAAR